MSRAFAASAALFLATSALGGEANPYLAQASVFYVGLEYEKCVERLERAGRWNSTPAEAVQVELYSGMCKYNLRRTDEAREHFRMALLLDPKVTLPPLTSPPIRELFASVAASLPVREVEPAREGTIAKTPTVLPASPPDAVAPLAASTVSAEAPARRRTWVLPVTLGGVAVAATGVGAFFGLRAREYEGLSNRAPFTSDAHTHASTARESATAANVSYAGAAVLAVSAAVTALLFPPDAEDRP